jgi:uncharacterized membrane protein
VDRVTAFATTVLELVGLSLLVVALGVAVGQRWGVPAACLSAGLACLAFSYLVASRTRPVAAVQSGADA